MAAPAPAPALVPALQPFSRLARVVVVAGSAVRANSLARRLSTSSPSSLGFDLEFTSSGQIALIQLSSESLTVLFHIAQFRGMFSSLF